LASHAGAAPANPLTNLAARVRRFVERHELWPHGARVVAAVSGGGDSVALVHLLRELETAGHVVLAGVAHLNHQLRPEAGSDEAFCRALAGAAGVPCDVARADVGVAAAAARVSVEVAGRDARYAFFEDVRVARGAHAVAVAHTRDDQAETVLLRLLRGTGTHGLRGALASRGGVVRPLLTCGRDELRAYLAARGVAWLEDTTNTDTALLRNRIRHDLLPRLVRDYQPGAARLLARTAELAHDDDAYLTAAADTAAGAVSSNQGEGWRVAAAALLALPPAIGRRVVVLTLQRAGATRAVRLADVERALDTCRSAQAAVCRVAGVTVERFSAEVVLFSRGDAPAGRPMPPRTLEVPGQVEVPECGAGWRLRAEGPIKRQSAPKPSRHRIVLDAAQGLGPFTVRGRRRGDRLRPVGLGGTKSLQDLFVDRKVPRNERDRTPVVVDAAGRILWVVGLALDEAAAAVEGADDVVVLNFERPDGSGPEAA
jgi:tRNA(Ile)-lysidine synthase